MEHELVSIATFLDVTAASLARARLEAHGIRCHVSNEHGAAIHPALGAASLQVSASVAEEARAILREEVVHGPPSDDPEDGPRCPSCAERYAEVERDVWSLIAAWITRGRIAPRAHLRCRRCRHVWTLATEPVGDPYR